MTFTREQKEQNTLIAMSYLIDKGWTPMQAAAIIGNLTVESYMNPDTPRGDEGTAAGIAQWRGDRMTKFEELYGKHVEDSTLKEQLDYVDWELKNNHKHAGRRLVAAKSLAEATMVVDRYYEYSAGLHGGKRIKHANAALNNWKNLTSTVKLASEPKKGGTTQLLEWLVDLFKQK
jgi:hypothetical protein